MGYPVTAQEEMLKRIQSLDREESFLRRKAGNLVAEAARAEAEAESTATVRRQYEFAVMQLGVDLPKPSGAPVPMKPAARVVAALG